jgi:hypothetical protein
LVFEEGKLRSSEGFPEPWDKNVSLEELTKKRRNANVGWINEEQ